MNQEKLKEKVSKIYELVKSGATDGEKESAKLALDRILKKHNLDLEFVAKINLKKYEFKYATWLDMQLFIQLHIFLFKEKKFDAEKSTLGRKSIFLELEYLDYIQLLTAYEYFKRHMNSEFKKFCLPLIARCRSVKTKNKRRSELQRVFFDKYVIKSKIYHPTQIENINIDKKSKKELTDRVLLNDIQGGVYHSQINTELYLE